MRLATVLLVALLCLGCSGNSGLVGKWEMKQVTVASTGKTLAASGQGYMEFKADGTVFSTSNLGGMANRSQGTYSLKGNTLTTRLEKSEMRFAGSDKWMTGNGAGTETAEIDLKGTSLTMRTNFKGEVLVTRYEKAP